jgi:hypothetical protein
MSLLADNLKWIDDEAKNAGDRATSWYEFLLDPSKLDKHVSYFLLYRTDVFS